MSRSFTMALYGALYAVMLAGTPATAAEVHWTYEGEEGPANWGALSEDFSACAAGRSQSPIDIAGTVSGGGGDIALNYRATALDLVNNGHTVQVNVEAGNSARLAGKTYELLQFHFHSPSEHTVAGRAYDMEMHLVHRNGDGALAVVGVLVEQGAANDSLEAIARNRPGSKGAAKIAGMTVSAAGLLPGSLDYNAYMGSLTTPPCSEGVAWFVLKNSITASAEQIKAMQAAMPDNARPTQPLNGRMIRVSN